MRQGIFIAFEGIDGCGKSTQVELLAERLAERNIRFVTTKEPSDGPVGKLLRQYLSGSLSTDEATLAALFAADRLDHITDEKDGIRKHMDAGACVLCDRYVLSSYAYQGVTLPPDWVKQLNRQATTLLVPDCQIFIDVPPETALARIAAGRAQRELFETSRRLTKVRERFLSLIENAAPEENIFTVDGTGSKEQVAEAVWETLTKKAGIDFSGICLIYRT